MAKKITNVIQVFSKAKTHEVTYLGYRDQYKVTSCVSGRFYVVSADKNRCTCNRQTFTKRDHVNACSHTQAVFAYRQAQYQLVARKEGEDVKGLKRKVFDGLVSDGVLFTGRVK